MGQVEELYKDYFHDVFLYIRSLSADEHLAEDITQETFFKAMKSVDSFRGDCDIRVWLCQIAKNLLYTHNKKQKRYTGEEIPETVPDTSVTMEELLENGQQSMNIHRVLHTLVEPYKEVFTLRVFGELSFRQIGDIFGKTESWARVTFHRAKLKIIEELEVQK
ncbi:RNA polymerase sigma factor [Ruminococcus flavefaciens]|uniref:RNA polymerase sigma-70 factor, ECF subfamily n=1 Tax=Ruminococcus flavefaciens TaxID=1265 RepID=A0A1M7MCN4_RUMFL|nr:sigma-70 family RNA polymerase sigma factor [Ruminococcus flavefaciens]SHM88542.1 RNA polymerase sigma-70 factor, ECF subfamily [Ruminococcus flavefaciens]